MRNPSAIKKEGVSKAIFPHKAAKPQSRKAAKTIALIMYSLPLRVIARDEKYQAFDVAISNYLPSVQDCRATPFFSIEKIVCDKNFNAKIRRNFTIESEGRSPEIFVALQRHAKPKGR